MSWREGIFKVQFLDMLSFNICNTLIEVNGKNQPCGLTQLPFIRGRGLQGIELSAHLVNFQVWHVAA